MLCETWACVDRIAWALEIMSITVLIICAVFARSYYRMIRELFTDK